MEMDDSKHIFIVNPAAGPRDRTTEIAGAIRAATVRRPIDYEIQITDAPRHAISLVQRAADMYPGRPLRFYACGGDGTLKEVAEGCLHVPNAAFTHYPAGTGNDFIKVFGKGADRFHDLGQLIGGEIIQVDGIESDCGLALNVLSVGVDARVAHSMQKYKRFPLLGSQGPYLVAAVEEVVKGLVQSYGVTVDGQSYDGRYTLIIAVNGYCYGGGFMPVPESSVDDGILDVLLVHAVSRATAAKVIGAYKNGYYRDYPQYITHLRARELTIYSLGGKQMDVNMDGEIVRTGHVGMRIAEKQMRVIVPIGVRPEVRTPRSRRQ